MGFVVSPFQRLTATALSSGVIVPTLCPFSDSGTVLSDSVTDQARRLARIDGILGIAVNTSSRELKCLSKVERVEVVRRTRTALRPGQLLLAGIGVLSQAAADEVLACKSAGADGVITFPPPVRDGSCPMALQDHIGQLVTLADGLSLPVIAACCGSTANTPQELPEIVALVHSCQAVIGVQMGARNNVLEYDQAYYKLKGVDRPLACLPSSEAALFHNLNTGADGVISYLAYLAPHEVAGLYRATRDGRYYDAQALHNRLVPLIGLISGHDKLTRELVFRYIAHSRGLLASRDARNVSTSLDQTHVETIESTLGEIALNPIKWV